MTLMFKDPYEDLILRIDGEGGEGDGGGSGGGAGAEGTGGEGSGQPPPAALTEDRVSAMIEAATKPYREQIADLKSTNVILAGQLRDRQQPTAPTQPAAPVDPYADLPDKDAFTAEADAHPAKAIIGLFDKYLMPKIRQEIGGVKNETQGEIQLRQQIVQAVEGDRTAALEVASSWGDENSETGALFNTYAEEELGKQCPFTITAQGRKMPDPRYFRPGMLETAALRAERRLRGEGKQQPQAQPVGRGNVVRLPPVRAGSSNGAPSGPGEGPPKTIDDLVAQGKLTADEGTAARSNCKKWGMTSEDFTKSWIQSEKENPRFGTGL